MSATAKTQELIRIEEASAHTMQTAEVDVYDGQGRFATFLIREDAQAFADSLRCLEQFMQYVAQPDDDTSELYRLHNLAQKIVRRFERRLVGGCI